MRWYKMADYGHGDTLDGQRLERDRAAVLKSLNELRNRVSERDGLEGVLPRWRGEIRRKILMLPTDERLNRFSMNEIDKLASQIAEITAEMYKYSSN